MKGAKELAVVEVEKIKSWLSQLADAIDDLRLVTCVNQVSDDFKSSAAGTISNIKEDLEDLLVK